MWLGVLVHEMLIGNRPFTEPSKRWQLMAEERKDCGSAVCRDDLIADFFSTQCRPYLSFPSRSGDDTPVSAKAWNFLTKCLLAPPSSIRRISTLSKDVVTEVQKDPFLDHLDWDAIESHRLPPIDINKTAGMLYKGEEDEKDEEELSAEQQSLFAEF